MPERESSLSIKLDVEEKETSDIKLIIKEIEKQWKGIYPDEPLRYNFLNESITWLYGQEKNTAWLVKVAMCITIFISCMGLFGLGMFTAKKRTKEIGIRKVLGATVTNITLMLGRDFVILIVIAIVIATPVAYYFMYQWLQDFAYRTNLSWWIFAFAGFGAIIIALSTVSFQAIRAAIVNPIKSLRTE
jgi:ABC-type antimicrobial peptide transport system permease subunit